jgi:CYTH domain-containing protein
MAKEIERKFLIKSDVWKPVTSGVTYRQSLAASISSSAQQQRRMNSNFVEHGIPSGNERYLRAFPILNARQFV